MKKNFSTIDEYIQTFSTEVQTILQRIRLIIHAGAPQAVETISYQIPTFDLNGKHLVHLAAWKKHIALYPTPAGDARLQREMAPFLAAKSSLHFPLDRPLPYALIEEIVKRRAGEQNR